MNKYDFIRFGGQAQWYDDREDRFRTMQVCSPFKVPVGFDTEISLITSGEAEYDEDEYDEERRDYSAKASELLPCLTPFDEGFWLALSEAQKNGVDEATLLCVLRSLEIDMLSCILMMHKNDYYHLYPIVCLLFPGIEEIFKVITWENKHYPVRKLTIYRGMPEEKKVWVSVKELLANLIDSRTGSPVSKEAEELNSTIYHYLMESEMGLSDWHVTALVERV